MVLNSRVQFAPLESVPAPATHQGGGDKCWGGCCSRHEDQVDPAGNTLTVKDFVLIFSHILGHFFMNYKRLNLFISFVDFNKEA